VLRRRNCPGRAADPLLRLQLVGYREQVRAQLSGVEVDPLVPNARPLQALLRTTRYGSRTARGDGAVRGDSTNVGRRL
jgi:hypothetical protein